MIACTQKQVTNKKCEIKKNIVFAQKKSNSKSEIKSKQRNKKSKTGKNMTACTQKPITNKQ